MLAFTTAPATPSFESIERDRKTRLLRLFCQIIIGFMACVLLPTIFKVVAGNFNSLLSNVWEFLSFFFYIASYRLAGRGRYHLATWLFALPAIGTITETLVKQSSNIWFLIVITLISLVAFSALMRTREVIVITGYYVILVFIQNLLQLLQRSDLPANPLDMAGTIFLSSLFYIVWTPTLAALLIFPAHSQTHLLKEHNRQLQKTLTELEARQQTGQVVSQEVLSLSSELKTTASQQALDSQQQAGTVAQLNTSVTELFATAQNISNLAEKIGRSAFSVAEESQGIEETTRQAVAQSRAGTEAVSHTTTAIQEVANLYQTLMEQLDELNSRNANSRRILDLIRSVANETHLLALNAAIEAAGAGEYGARFSIIAQEVKDLAARSANAGKEVVEIVQGIEEMTQIALQSAQTGYEKSQQMQNMAEQSDIVINQLREVAENSQGQANAINEAIQMVVQQAETIKTAIGHQRMSGEQIVEALNGLSHVAQRNAAGGSQLSSTANQMEQVSSRLNLALAV